MDYGDRGKQRERVSEPYGGREKYVTEAYSYCQRLRDKQNVCEAHSINENVRLRRIETGRYKRRYLNIRRWKNEYSYVVRD